MNQELRALEENGTWAITTLPPGKTVIGCKWLYKTKFISDGTIEIYKARVVVQGGRRRYGVDYQETFAPIAKMTTVRTLLAAVAMKGWHTCQMDVSNAFLHGDLDEEVYMTLPQGYCGYGTVIEPGQPAPARGSVKPAKVCCLLNSLYGLK